MSSSSSSKAVEIFKKLSNIPSLSKAVFEKTPNKDYQRITATWKQRDLIKNEMTSFTNQYIVSGDVVDVTAPVCLNNTLWQVRSNAGDRTAILRQLKDKDKPNEVKQFLEIWGKSCRTHNIPVSTLEAHGVFYNDDGIFGSLSWSKDDGKLLFIAERKVAKFKTFFNTDIKAEGEEGTTFLFRDNWGEQLTKKVEPMLCVFDLSTLTSVCIDWLPGSTSYGQAVWGANDDTIYVIGWANEPYKLGLIYCPIRKNNLFEVDLKNKTYKTIDNQGQSISSPILNPNGDKLAYLVCQQGGPHHQESHMVVCGVVDGVAKRLELKPMGWDDFPGINHPGSMFKWIDGERIIINNVCRSRVELMVIDTTSSTVTKISKDDKIGSWTLLDVNDQHDIIVCCSSLSEPDYLMIGRLPAAGSESAITWKRLSQSDQSFTNDIIWTINDIKNTKFSQDFVDYQYILVEPANVQADKQSLIVWNHGGPHSAFTVAYSLKALAHCLLGYSLLLTNYRGSLGYGQASIQCLSGHVGTQDVDDVKHALDTIIEKKQADPNKLVVIGGSHGGFLTLHLIGQYPDLFKSAIAVNSVVNMTNMLGVSDIPDWIYSVIGKDFDPHMSLSPDLLENMRIKSPLHYANNMKTPLLIQIGGVDMRVPPSQSLQLYKVLKSYNQTVRVYIYPESCHPISEVECEADVFVNGANWLEQYLQ